MIADLYLSDYMSERVLFNVWFRGRFFPEGEVFNALKAAIEEFRFHIRQGGVCRQSSFIG